MSVNNKLHQWISSINLIMSNQNPTVEKKSPSQGWGKPTEPDSEREMHHLGPAGVREDGKEPHMKKKNTRTSVVGQTEKTMSPDLNRIGYKSKIKSKLENTVWIDVW